MTSKRGANKTGYDSVSGLKPYFDVRNILEPAILLRFRALTSARTITASSWRGGLMWTLLVTAFLGLWGWIERARILTGAV